MISPVQSMLDFEESANFSPVVESYITRQAYMLEHLGGRYIRNYITKNEANSFLRHIDGAKHEWLTDLKRRVQHYGYRYDYQARKISADMRIGNLPKWISPLSKCLEKEFFDKYPEQMIINEYQPGQGISPHVDCIPCFGSVVVSISLGSTCVMTLTRSKPVLDGVYSIADVDSERIDLLLEPRSLVMFSGASRNHWAHGIAARKSDTIEGFKYKRTRRVSLTFRTLIT